MATTSNGTQFCLACGGVRKAGAACSNRDCSDPMLSVRVDATMAAIEMARRTIDDLERSVRRLVVSTQAPGVRRKIAQRLRESRSGEPQ